MEDLADKLRRREATTRLTAAGRAGVEAARDGLSHPDAEVRAMCAAFLDHCALDDETTRRLVGALDDFDSRVRTWAAHTLACEVCKPDEGPATRDFLPKVLSALAADSSPNVRRTAAGTLGQHRSNPEVRAALERAYHTDPHTKVRLHAAWALGLKVSFLHQLHPPQEVRLSRSSPAPAARRAGRRSCSTPATRRPRA